MTHPGKMDHLTTGQPIPEGVSAGKHLKIMVNKTTKQQYSFSKNVKYKTEQRRGKQNLVKSVLQTS